MRACHRLLGSSPRFDTSRTVKLVCCYVIKTLVAKHTSLEGYSSSPREDLAMYDARPSRLRAGLGIRNWYSQPS